MELLHFPTDWQLADIFTKPFGLDKLRFFSGMHGVQRLDMSNLRGSNENRTRKEDVQKAKLDFNPTKEVGMFGWAEEVED